MFLRAGVLSLPCCWPAGLLGLVRESAQAAAFGATGMGDVAVLMLTLPDWLAGVLASGALAYVLLPAWAREEPAQVAASQRAWRACCWRACLLARLCWLRGIRVAGSAGGLPRPARPAAQALLWSAVALPLACWPRCGRPACSTSATFVGMYCANLVVNVC
jgi:hypothetical protein